MITIAAPYNTPHFRQRVTLDGAEYLLTCEWNQRAEKWYFSVAAADETRVLTGVKLVADYPLLTLARWNDQCPEGELYAVDSSGQGLDPHLLDLANEDGSAPRVRLVYLTAEEREQLESA